MSANMNKVFLAASALSALLALGHTSKGREQFQHLTMEKLPKVLRAACTTGWYEGSVFFAILSVLNFKWAQAGNVLDIYDKGIIGLYTSLLVGAGSSYASAGDAQTGVTLAVVAIVQAAAAYVA